MTDEHIITLKKNIIAIGRLLWEKDLVSGLNGNISARVDDEVILLTATATCLGLLREKDILRMRLDGEVLDEGEVSKERLLHIAIYRHLLQTQAVIHTHTTFTNAYFLERDKFIPKIFESRFYLGEVAAVEQTTPSVTDCQPVVDALRNNNIMVLKNHGVVAVGTDLFDCFLLIQCLEEAVKTDAVSRRPSEKQPTQKRSLVNINYFLKNRSMKLSGWLTRTRS
jgi:L-fuculose-phosphate aldolase